MEIVKILKRTCGTAVLSLALAAGVSFSCGNGIPAVYAAQFTDTADHWAAEYIERAVDYGFVNGYSDGTFRPDDPITRAEFTKIVNSVLENDLMDDINFEAVSYTHLDVYKRQVRRCSRIIRMPKRKQGKKRQKKRRKNSPSAPAGKRSR